MSGIEIESEYQLMGHPVNQIHDEFLTSIILDVKCQKINIFFPFISKQRTVAWLLMEKMLVVLQTKLLKLEIRLKNLFENCLLSYKGK